MKERERTDKEVFNERNNGVKQNTLVLFFDNYAEFLLRREAIGRGLCCLKIFFLVYKTMFRRTRNFRKFCPSPGLSAI